MLEVITMVGGLILGWFTVSYIISLRRKSHRAEKLLSFSDKDLESLWPKLLQVSENATQEDIRQAYERRLTELSESTPRVVTEQERAAQRSARERLEDVYKYAARRSQNG